MNRTHAVLHALLHKPLTDAIEALSKGYRGTVSAILLRALTMLQMYSNGALSLAKRRTQPKQQHCVDVDDYIQIIGNLQSAAARMYKGEYLFTDAELFYAIVEFYGRVFGTTMETLI